MCVCVCVCVCVGKLLSCYSISSWYVQSRLQNNSVQFGEGSFKARSVGRRFWLKLHKPWLRSIKERKRSKNEFREYTCVSLFTFRVYLGGEGVWPFAKWSWVLKPSLSPHGRGARGVMVIVVGNGHGDTSSNPGRGLLHFT